MNYIGLTQQAIRFLQKYESGPTTRVVGTWMDGEQPVQLYRHPLTDGFADEFIQRIVGKDVYVGLAVYRDSLCEYYRWPTPNERLPTAAQSYLDRYCVTQGYEGAYRLTHGSAYEWVGPDGSVSLVIVADRDYVVKHEKNLETSK